MNKLKDLAKLALSQEHEIGDEVYLLHGDKLKIAKIISIEAGSYNGEFHLDYDVISNKGNGFRTTMKGNDLFKTKESLLENIKRLIDYDQG